MSGVMERLVEEKNALVEKVGCLEAENAKLQTTVTALKLQRDGYSKVIDLLRKHAEAMADAKHVYDWETHAAAYRADFPKEPDNSLSTYAKFHPKEPNK